MKNLMIMLLVDGNFYVSNFKSNNNENTTAQTLKFDVLMNVFGQDLPYFPIIKESINELVPFFYSDFIR